MNTTASKITIGRILLVPIFLVLLYLDFNMAAFAVYVIACLSDMLDGYVARHYNQVSNFGKFVDPLADKILVLAAMCYFVEIGTMPGWCVAIVLFREFAVSGLRLIAAEKKRVIAAAKSGKIKTLFTMVGLGAMMILGKYYYVNLIATVLIVASTVYSGIQYFRKNIDVLRD